MIGILAGILSNTKRVFAIDAFNRADGALGNADSGGAWTVNNATVTIVSGKAKGGQATYNNTATLVMPVTDYQVFVDVTWYSGETIAIVARCNPTNITYCMLARYSGSSIEIVRVINDVSTVVATFSYVWVSGATRNVSFRCAGNVFTVYVDGVLIAGVTDDNATKTKYNVGFQVKKPSVIPVSTFKNFRVTEL